MSWSIMQQCPWFQDGSIKESRLKSARREKASKRKQGRNSGQHWPLSKKKD